MKKNYEKPLAKKVTFNYQKVVASSQNCIWHTPKNQGYRGCQEITIGMIVNTVALDGNNCGWMTPDD